MIKYTNTGWMELSTNVYKYEKIAPGFLDPNADLSTSTESDCSVGSYYDCANDGAREPDTSALESNYIGGDSDGVFNLFEMSTSAITNNVTTIDVWVYISDSGHEDNDWEIDLSVDDSNSWEGVTAVGFAGSPGWYKATFSGLQYDQDMIDNLRVKTILEIVGGSIQMDAFYVKLTEAEVEDTTPPTYSDAQTNTTVANTAVNFSILYDDETALHPNGLYVFSTNNSDGTWTNDSAVNFNCWL